MGAFLFSLAVALTLGNAATDLPFSDRLIVSSKTSQVLTWAAGCMFGVGNTLLLGAVSLLGVAAAFGISGGLALAIGLAIRHSDIAQLPLAAALAFFLIGSMLAALSRRAAEPVPAPQPLTRGQAPPPLRLRRSTKGVLVGILGAVAIAFSFPLTLRGAFDEFGLGPYAGLFIFSAGMLLTNLIFSLYFFNIALEGGALPLKSYLRDWPGRHLPGILGGAIWAMGALSLLLLRGNATPDASAFSGSTLSGSLYLPMAAIPLAMALGIFAWKEFRLAPKPATLLITLALISIVVAILALFL